MSTYVYTGPYSAAKLGGSMDIDGRTIHIPDVVVNVGDTVELDDEYVAWVGPRGHRFARVESSPAADTPTATVKPSRQTEDSDLTKEEAPNG